MRIALHDFGSYSFPVQLARRMAEDGHDVHYVHSDFYEVKGGVESRVSDSSNFHIHKISIGEAHKRYQFAARAVQEVRYARTLNRLLDQLNPQWLISCNTPLLTCYSLAGRCRSSRRGYVHWGQDLHSTAIQSVFSRKNRVLGRLVGTLARYLERSTIQSADALVVISEDFLTELADCQIAARRARVIPNWMPLDEIVPAPKVNAWSTRNNMADTVNLMYVGTLSLKHDIAPFVNLCEHFRDDPRVRIVVVSGGIAYEHLAAERRIRGLDNLVLFGWQKYEELSLILGCADVLFAAIPADASRFSVPCKVLTYACAGKPVLAYMPRQNLMYKIVAENQLGEVADFGDTAGLLAAADRLVRDESYRAECSRRARAYAEQSFDVGEKAGQFYQLLGESFAPCGAN